jgi:hypothetical protein
MNRRPAGLLAVAASLSLPIVATSPSSASPPAPGVCAGVPGCHVVARVDVDGDAQRDTVGIARRGEEGAERGAVLVRVRLASGRTLSTTRRTEFWFGPLWQGAAALDGRAGKELVVGRTTGAHAQIFQALAYRTGRLGKAQWLELLPAPGKGRYWYIDRAVWISAGWKKVAGEPAGVIHKRIAMRRGDATRSPFDGTATKYRWTRDGWERLHVRTVKDMSDQQVDRWGGWRVPGLQRW